MFKIIFKMYFSGMSEETFSDKVMIYKPFKTITKEFTLEILRVANISDINELIKYIKADPTFRNALGKWNYENFNISTTYIDQPEYLLGINENKSLDSIFSYFNTKEIEFSHFIVGGASIHNETNYKFTVHTNEKIHKHMPHVHVSKEGVEIRYSLENLTPIDPLKNPHRRDNKRIITPFLKDNQHKLLKMWQDYINGYRPPELAEDGRQFYNES